MSHTRRRFLNTLGLGAAWLYTPGAFAQTLALTPRQTEGPFYPTRLPLDTDNDLLILNDALTPGVGEITHLSGRLLDQGGTPIRNAVIEIWQVDGHGVYLHGDSSDAAKRDANFQGFGRFLTGSTGEYYFRTVKPVPYPGRTPHVHFAVKRKGAEKFTTQLYIKGHPGNARDGLYNSVKDPKLREAITADFAPLEGSTMGELRASFDIVLGTTPRG